LKSSFTVLYSRASALVDGPKGQAIWPKALHFFTSSW
jgi:hypothetical protein